MKLRRDTKYGCGGLCHLGYPASWLRDQDSNLDLHRFT